MTGPASRCAVHSARPAVDDCPVCGRPRCAADAARGASGCAACAGGPPAGAASSGPTGLERWVRASLGASACAYAGGPVLAEYVGAPALLAYLAPFVLGVLCGAAAVKAAGGPRRVPWEVRVVSALYAVLGTAFGFTLEASLPAFSAHHQVLYAYACAVAGAIAWTRPPRAPRPADRGVRPPSRG